MLSNPLSLSLSKSHYLFHIILHLLIFFFFYCQEVTQAHVVSSSNTHTYHRQRGDNHDQQSNLPSIIHHFPPFTTSSTSSSSTSSSSSSTSSSSSSPHHHHHLHDTNYIHNKIVQFSPKQNNIQHPFTKPFNPSHLLPNITKTNHRQLSKSNSDKQDKKVENKEKDKEEMTMMNNNNDNNNNNNDDDDIMDDNLTTSTETYEWFVSIYRILPDESTEIYCSGTLIDTEFVLTAAHCQPKVGDMAFIGAVCPYRKDNCLQQNMEIIEIKKVYVHDNYITDFWNGVPSYDMALLQLYHPTNIITTPVSIDHGIFTSQYNNNDNPNNEDDLDDIDDIDDIDYNDYNDNDNEIDDNGNSTDAQNEMIGAKHLLVMGLGFMNEEEEEGIPSSKLIHSEVEYVPNDICQMEQQNSYLGKGTLCAEGIPTLDSSSIVSSSSTTTTTTTTILLGSNTTFDDHDHDHNDDDGHKDYHYHYHVCTIDDTGGPLFDMDNNVVVGILSYKTSCNTHADSPISLQSVPSTTTTKPGVYAKISDGWSWIQSTICEESTSTIPPELCSYTASPTLSSVPTISPSICNDGMDLELSLTTDRFSTETYWIFSNIETNEIYGLGGDELGIDNLQDRTDYVAHACLPLLSSSSMNSVSDDTGCYQFAIYDTFGDGIKGNAEQGYCVKVNGEEIRCNYDFESHHEFVNFPMDTCTLCDPKLLTVELTTPYNFDAHNGKDFVLSIDNPGTAVAPYTVIYGRDLEPYTLYEQNSLNLCSNQCYTIIAENIGTTEFHIYLDDVLVASHENLYQETSRSRRSLNSVGDDVSIFKFGSTCPKQPNSSHEVGNHHFIMTIVTFLTTTYMIMIL